jgi:hemerythrin
MALAWSEELSVGNAMIDAEHKNLIVMVNSLVHAISAKDLAALPHAFEQLEIYLCAHFANEEKLALAIKFPFDHNMQEHNYLLNTFQLIRGALASMIARSGMWAEDAVEHFAELLSDWFTNHVIHEDMLMKPVLLTYPYDFKPA